MIIRDFLCGALFSLMIKYSNYMKNLQKIGHPFDLKMYVKISILQFKSVKIVKE